MEGAICELPTWINIPLSGHQWYCSENQLSYNILFQQIFHLWAIWLLWHKIQKKLNLLLSWINS